MSIRSFVTTVQHGAASALGIDEHQRTQTVVTMVENNRRRAPGYWIQLVLATGIATLGLVLDSTAVVIGAMLVSPLMNPLLELGMGFTVGSAFLVFRASIRVTLSVLVVVAGSALLTIALPFHDLTSEIAARTAPTALDLLIAVFCALTAAYTTVRPTSDTTSAAAGTAIGIALVPPLCVTGFGIGIGAMPVAGGAMLLFTANLSGIMVLSVLGFLTLGFNQVRADRVESELASAEERSTDRLAVRAEVGLQSAFGSRYGLALRLVIPLVFLAAVFVPLRRALEEVTWQVRARDAVRRILADEAPRAVQTRAAVEHHTISLRLVVVGSQDHAANMERHVRTRVETATGVAPNVVMTAVPDTRALSAMTTAVELAAHSEASRADPIDLSALRSRVEQPLLDAWPRAAAGELLDWMLTLPARGDPILTVYHIGPALGAAGEALLARALDPGLSRRPHIADSALVTTVAVAPLGRELAWRTAAWPLLRWVATVRGAAACVRGPLDRRSRSAGQRATIDSIRTSAANRAGRVTLADSSAWRIVVVAGACPSDSSPARRAPPVAP